MGAIRATNGATTWADLRMEVPPGTGPADDVCAADDGVARMAAALPDLAAVGVC
jgi:hypothetical protein